MKFSEQWLREWANPPISHEELLSQLTMLGLEVDSAQPVAGVFNEVLVGEILSITKHPEADRLNVCQVNVNQKHPLSIVCGGINVRPGLKVAVAMVGAELPNDIKIKKAKLRGVVSEGMICSASELELGSSAKGLILELPEDAPVGKDFRQYYQLDDYMIDIDLTPNRGDCLSVLGIAREVSVVNRCELKTPRLSPAPIAINDVFPVTLSAPEACPQYVGRVIKNINPQVSVPLWMQERLRRSGLRSIDIVVDVTNYVMLELGQPMHAFDHDKLSGGIHVRMAKRGEKVELLDGKDIKLDEKCLVIADDKHVLALAGVMGAGYASINSSTKNIFLESAFFAPLAIAGRARAFGLNTDSAHRFERGVNPEMQRLAIERATELLLNLAGGQAGPVIQQTVESYLPTSSFITLRASRIKKILGISIPDKDVMEILQRLGMTVYSQEESLWEVQVPSFRFDLSLEIDLIEEIARVHGYQKIPMEIPLERLSMQSLSEKYVPIRTFTDYLLMRDYHEVITYSFVDPKIQALLYPDTEALNLLNPISPELSQMRLSLWPGLLQTAIYNQNRQQTRLRFFEEGLSYVPGKSQLKQERMLAGIVIGSAWPEQWGMPKRSVDFFDVKVDIENFCALTHHRSDCRFLSEQHPALHPGQTARIYCGREPVGWVGALHPQIEASLQLEGPIYLFELTFELLKHSVITQFKPLSKYPSIRRDISFLVDRSVSVRAIIDTVVANKGELLAEVQLFDVYAGQAVDPTKKSLALSLLLQHQEKTLIDEEVNNAVNGIVTQLGKKFHIMMRDSA